MRQSSRRLTALLLATTIVSSQAEPVFAAFDRNVLIGRIGPSALFTEAVGEPAETAVAAPPTAVATPQPTPVQVTVSPTPEVTLPQVSAEPETTTTPLPSAEPSETPVPAETPAAAEPAETPAAEPTPAPTASVDPEPTPTPTPVPTATVDPTPAPIPTPAEEPTEESTEEPSEEPEVDPEEEAQVAFVVQEEPELSLEMSAQALTGLEPTMSLSSVSEQADKPAQRAHFYRVGYGVPVSVKFDAKSNQVAALSAFGDNFGVEAEAINGHYGYVKNYEVSKTTPRVSAGSIGYTFCIFPSNTMLGRVPDQQFEGWYLYPRGAAKVDADGNTVADSAPGSWVYADREDYLISVEGILQDYTEGSPGYSSYSSYGDRWDGGWYYNGDLGGDAYNYVDPTGRAGLDANNPVSFVGRWVASDESRAAESGIKGADGNETAVVTLTGTDENGNSVAIPVTFDRDTPEYNLQVAANVTEVSLTFNTYEIYYDWNKDGATHDGKSCPVVVTNAFGNALKFTSSAELKGTMLPKAVETDINHQTESNIIPQNSVDNPAHTEWQVENIPLSISAGAGSLTNDISVKVTSPSGNETTTYVFHIQRAADPTLTQKPGNTPYGMIMRDTGNLSSTTEKRTAKTLFVSATGSNEAEKKAYAFDSQEYPNDNTNNQNGAIFRDSYSTYAWRGSTDDSVNLDLNDTAIVAYQNSVFQDPGIVVTDVDGNTVDLTQGAVTRTIKLRTTNESLTTALVGDGFGDACYYAAHSLSTEPASETLTNAAGTDKIDLRGLKVLPGIYTIEYTYTYEENGQKIAYDSVGANFVTNEGKANKMTFSRDLVILPIPGDVDMDGAVTLADAFALDAALTLVDTNGNVLPLQTRFNNRLIRGSSADKTAALFAFRVCDVNHDGAVDKNDVAKLRELAIPQLQDGTESDYYYIPLPTGEAAATDTRPLLTTGADANKAVMSLEYLGMESGTRRSDGKTLGITDNAAGPWSRSIDKTTGITLADAGEKGDTFWVGVKLENSDKLPDFAVDGFTFTLTYDARYVKPAIVLGESEWQGTDLDKWRATVRKYNIGQAGTPWYGKGYDFTEAAGEREFSTMHHVSEAKTSLEASMGGATSTQLRDQLGELVFSIRHISGTAVQLNGLGDGYLLAVPFTLVNHPAGQTSADLVEIKAGMSDFTLVDSTNTPPTAAAYSVGDIFGGATINLKDHVTFSTTVATVPLGRDRTKAYYLTNQHRNYLGENVYSTPFEANNASRVNDEGVTEYVQVPSDGEAVNLPPWLTWSNGKLSGTPTRANQSDNEYYEFTIKGIRFRMHVDKAEIKYWAESQESYYGQNEFRGEEYDFPFRYDTNDICSIERERAEDSNGTIVVDGNGVNLAALLSDSNYYAPQFYAATEKGSATAVTNKTGVGSNGVGSHPIQVLAGRMPISTNYKFTYVDTGVLTIYRRPILVTQLVAGTNVGTGLVYTDTQNNYLAGLTAMLGDQPGEFTAELPKDAGAIGAVYSGRPLTGDPVVEGDSLTITYTATYLRNDRDVQGAALTGNQFTLEGEHTSETRPVSVSDIVLSGGTGYENYNLRETTPVINNSTANPNTVDVVGTVLRRNILGIRLNTLPSPMEYRYGDPFSDDTGLTFYLLKEGDATEGIYKYNPVTTQAQYGLSVTWATDTEKKAYKEYETCKAEYEDREKAGADGAELAELARKRDDAWAAVEQLHQETALPYVRGGTFTMEHDGRYICVASVSEPFKVYSTVALKVTPRVLTLTASPAQRFYGEANGALTFTYNPSQLAGCDKPRDENGNELALTGSAEELASILSDADGKAETRGWQQGYTAPTVRAVKWQDLLASGWTKLDELAEVSATDNAGVTTDYAVAIAGAKCDSGNYVFQYTYTNQLTEAQRTVPQEDDDPSYGTSAFIVRPRLIIVDRVLKGSSDNPLASIYADTRQIFVKDQQLTLEEVVLGLPNVSADGTGVQYFPEAKGAWNNDPNIERCTYADGAEPILDVDKEKIYFTYTATFAPTDGENYIYYTDFYKGYFNMSNMTDAEKAQGYKEYPVQVSDLTLKGTAGNERVETNYTLVYRENYRAALAIPQETKAFANCVEPQQNANKTYHAPLIDAEDTSRYGIGRVALRPIEKIELQTAGKIEYTYGDDYHPDSGQKMQVAIEYTTEGDNYDRNTTRETVAFNIRGYDENDKPITTFDQRNLEIWAIMPDGTEKKLEYQEEMTVVFHNGGQLQVRGKRGGQAETIKSTNTDGLNTTLKVSPRILTIKADDQKRIYGESNDTLTLTYTFNANELAPKDREALGNVTGSQSGTLLATLAQSARFKPYRDAGITTYTAPTVTVQAEQGSPVKDGGKSGYAISISGGSLTDNYTLRPAEETGTLYIYPRPVRIYSFDKKPIYTIYSDTEATVFYTNVVASPTRNDFTLTGPLRNKHIFGDGTELSVDGSSTALYGSDSMTLRIELEYVGQINGDGVERFRVEKAEIVSGTEAAENYLLVSIYNATAIGEVELRSIGEISLRRAPFKLDYMYGQALDLTGLAITVKNSLLADETTKTDEVSYIGDDDLAMHGLYMNYVTREQYTTIMSLWDELQTRAEAAWSALDVGTRENVSRTDPEAIRRALKNTGKTSEYNALQSIIDQMSSIKDNYPKVMGGGHLTIAPTHETQGTGSEFAANGKYLLITGQLDAEHIPVKPILVETPITVSPLPLTFTLSAQDKTYDGTVRTAGSLTLTNPYNRNGVTDRIFVATGAAYENAWANLKTSYENFESYVATNGYKFSTGSYTHSEDTAMGENGIDWTSGYVWGSSADRLTFSFLDPNVAYAEATTHEFDGALTTKEVQATGIRLLGSDAANYTLATDVTTSTVTSAVGYEGTALPRATIYKANRDGLPIDILPRVEVEPHTNVVRIVYEKDPATIVGVSGAGEETDHLDELHFESALQMISHTTDGEGNTTITDITQLTDYDSVSLWWDDWFFGGEDSATVLSNLDFDLTGYVPEEDDIPKEEDLNEDSILKGQVYAWADEDGGFVLIPSAYPGSPEEPWPGYYLYELTNRTALERDAIYLPVVRAAATNNYKASPVLSSVRSDEGGDDYSPELIQELLDAKDGLNNTSSAEEYAAAETRVTAAVAAAQPAILATVVAAQKAAQDEVDWLNKVGEDGKWPEEGFERTPAAAVKTYLQRIDAVSTKELKSADDSVSTEDYTVPTLEAVWFTDVLEYPKKEYMDAVLRNNDPVRYRRYGWGSEFDPEIDFENKEGLYSGSLLEDQFDVTIKRKDADKQEEEVQVTFNMDHTALIFVDITKPSGGGIVMVQEIFIDPGDIDAVLGDTPIKLNVSFNPTYVTNRVLHWTSSDESVVTVDRDGVVTFVGEGVAVITATSVDGSNRSASVTVTVKKSRSEYVEGVFDAGRLDAYFPIGEDWLFHPSWEMTRGEVAELLARFYVEDPETPSGEPIDFPDLTGEESYYEAARLLSAAGIYKGFPDGTFGGDRTITRAEFIALLVRMLKLEVPDTTGQKHAFLDTNEDPLAPDGTWAYREIDAVSKVPGLVRGTGMGYFNPKRNITRAEVVSFIDRLLKFREVDETGPLIIPKDVGPDHWAYKAVVRAVNQGMNQLLTETETKNTP